MQVLVKSKIGRSIYFAGKELSPDEWKGVDIETESQRRKLERACLPIAKGGYVEVYDPDAGPVMAPEPESEPAAEPSTPRYGRRKGRGTK